MATVAPGGPDDVTASGCWLPTTSVDQYRATLAKWIDASPAELTTIFPSLVNLTCRGLGYLTP